MTILILLNYIMILASIPSVPENILRRLRRIIDTYEVRETVFSMKPSKVVLGPDGLKPLFFQNK